MTNQMTGAELIKAGKLADARQQLVQEVKAAPGDLGKRTTLSQVLCFCGEWDKADRQLDAIAVQDPSREAGVSVYKGLIQAERQRHNVLQMNEKPNLLPKAPPYFDTYWAALASLLDGKIDEADGLFEKVEKLRPPPSGSLNGTPFTGISDTDSFLSFFLEAIVHERYVWIPFESIREWVITPPKTLFDLIWVSSSITAWSGLTLNCFLPVRYGESHTDTDEQLRLGRVTHWSDLGGPFAKASGGRVIEIGGNDVALLEIQEILFEAPPDGSAATG